MHDIEWGIYLVSSAKVFFYFFDFYNDLNMDPYENFCHVPYEKIQAGVNLEGTVKHYFLVTAFFLNQNNV